MAIEPLFTHFARLRIQLAAMENDLSLHDLTTEERDLICTIIDLSAPDGKAAHVSEMRSHPLCMPISKPTFYRALHHLCELGVVIRSGSERSGLYAIRPGSLGTRNAKSS